MISYQLSGSEVFLVRDFVRSIAPQHGHLNFAIVRNILHIEHLFWPISYRDPFGTFSPLYSSQIPLQE